MTSMHQQWMVQSRPLMLSNPSTRIHNLASHERSSRTCSRRSPRTSFFFHGYHHAAVRTQIDALGDGYFSSETDNAPTAAASGRPLSEASGSELLEAAEISFGFRIPPVESGSESSDADIKASILEAEIDLGFRAKLAQCEAPHQVLDLLAQKALQRRQKEDRALAESAVVSRRDLATVLQECVYAGVPDLALAILKEAKESFLINRQAAGPSPSSSPSASSAIFSWPSPSISSSSSLLLALASTLRVADAQELVADVARRGLPQGVEVMFGKIVDCPTCDRPLAVVQPQAGQEVAACSCCRYEFELVSGDVTSIETENTSADQSLLSRGLRLLRIVRTPPVAAVHDALVRAPDSTARLLSFGTATSDLPAQSGDRVTVVCAAPEKSARIRIPGILQSTARTPGLRPSEPMAVTNHFTGQVTKVLRAPDNRAGQAASPSTWLLPLAAVLASADAASGLLDPSLPLLLAAGAAGTAAAGSAARKFVLPKLNQLPQRSVDALAVRQKLLSQRATLEDKLRALTAAASQEVILLARLCQLQNKMNSVGEPQTYGARLGRVAEARSGLESRLTARLKLIDNYAKIASMVEIEVEMAIDVVAAEAAGAAANFADQIEKLMEVESLQKEWQQQAEANDEVERLLRNSPMPESI